MNIHMQGNPWKKAKYYVYVIANNDGIHYVGVTNCPERRIAQHRDGTGAKFTRSQSCRDWQLHWLWYFPDFASAHKWECILHKYTKKGLEKEIKDHPEVDDYILNRIAVIPSSAFDLMTDKERSRFIASQRRSARA